MTEQPPHLFCEDLTLAECAAATGGALRGVTRDVRIKGVSTDTRTITPGQLFVALSGPNFDGHDFLDAAFEAGASGAIVSHDVAAPPGKFILVVEDTLAALQHLGARVWQAALERGVRGIALTGSNGKTTTKEILRALWSCVATTYATEGNLNNHIGVPLTLCNMPVDTEVAILEMGANQPGDIGELIALAPSSIRIITSIGQAHIEGFGGLDGVRRTKRQIFDGASPEDVAIVPVTEAAHLITDEVRGEVLEIGEGGDVTAQVVEATARGMRVRLAHAPTDSEITCVLPLFGEHNAHNLATAAATFVAAGHGFSALEAIIEDAMVRVDLPDGRWREVTIGERWVVVDDAYNANPSSVLASFEAFMTWQGQAAPASWARVAVIGEMLELGEETKSWHERVGRSIAQHDNLSSLICVGSYAPDMVAAANSAAGEETTILAAADTAEATRTLWGMAPAVVFLKASRGARLERIVATLREREGDAPSG